ncbi:anchored repeat-type ABC transporter permease subunit [Corynebacterium tapiri]|uniref:Anchored repeat-type ABC transporter permease subunit n=1 Tax=Corynebacterium tapiri TaxID=1448266 RepID=A0A5C4U1R8_9CORY|nr:anchored repeat-type ABC transporter permease subunit [Corynebacterium tapiri]TNL95703.1 anchored repeat-type ABC transporter permease subunit [Corynebacterium tapiri]
MLTVAQFIQDLSNPALGFLPRALIAAVIAAITCAVVGTFVVLRSMAFIGDAVAHAVFPGVAIAFALHASVLLGGAIAGAAVAIGVALGSQRRRVKEDSLIGVFFAAAFALGMVVISRVEGYTASLTSFLFGSLTGVSRTHVITSLVVGALVIALMVIFLRPMTNVALDAETARAMNIPVALFDVLLYLCVTAAVVISVQSVGNILVLALLITPAATARLMTNSLPTMMMLAAIIGALSSVLGLYLSWAIDLPAGATIVLTITAVFVVVWAFFGQRRARS